VNYKILFSKEAIETFQLISDQIVEKWGENHLIKFKERALHALITLEKSPYLYPYISNDQLNIRKCIFHKNCSFLYKIENQTVYILCFWDNRQQPIF
jgi:hypothetical protein